MLELLTAVPVGKKVSLLLSGRSIGSLGHFLFQIFNETTDLRAHGYRARALQTSVLLKIVIPYGLSVRPFHRL